jgi:hypothetical protein
MSNQEALFNTVVDIAEYLLSGGTLRSDSDYNWLYVFDTEELTEFITGLKPILNNPQSTAKELSDSIYEWKESAIAITSVGLDSDAGRGS